MNFKRKFKMTVQNRESLEKMRDFAKDLPDEERQPLLRNILRLKILLRENEKWTSDDERVWSVE